MQEYELYLMLQRLFWNLCKASDKDFVILLIIHLTIDDHVERLIKVTQ